MPPPTLLTKTIDAVYTWCDGSDPQFKKQKQERFAQLGTPFVEDNSGDLRFYDNNELLYSLRSLHKNAPWINRIFIVTNKQKPNWLASCPKIVVVDHEEIIPKHLLPTFSSVVIENYIHNIPSLSEKFIYLNDDMFLNHPVPPSFFFDGELPIIRLKEPGRHLRNITLEDARNILKRHSESDYTKTVLKAWLLTNQEKHYGPFLVLAHTIDGMTKSLIQETLERFPEIHQSNVSPFRTNNEIQRLIFQLDWLYRKGARLNLQKRPSMFVKLFGSRKGIEAFEGTECDKIRERIIKFNPTMFCLNADIYSNPIDKKKSRELLEKLFPEKSPFER